MPIVSLKNNTTSVEKTTAGCSPTAQTHHCNNAHFLKKDKIENKASSNRASLLSRREDDPWVDISSKRLTSSRLGALYDGSRFKGVQKCGANKYNVIVDIQVYI